MQFLSYLTFKGVKSNHDDSASSCIEEICLDGFVKQDPASILYSVFGHLSFLPGQKEAIDYISSRKDTVIVIPTGYS